MEMDIDLTMSIMCVWFGNTVEGAEPRRKKGKCWCVCGKKVFDLVHNGWKYTKQEKSFMSHFQKRTDFFINSTKWKWTPHHWQ